jgi:hypothetical protein
MENNPNKFKITTAFNQAMENLCQIIAQEQLFDEQKILEITGMPSKEPYISYFSEQDYVVTVSEKGRVLTSKKILDFNFEILLDDLIELGDVATKELSSNPALAEKISKIGIKLARRVEDLRFFMKEEKE